MRTIRYVTSASSIHYTTRVAARRRTFIIRAHVINKNVQPKRASKVNKTTQVSPLDNCKRIVVSKRHMYMVYTHMYIFIYTIVFRNRS